MILNRLTIVLGVIALCGLFACQENAHTTTQLTNPAAPGFNETASDSLAISIADEVMEAMGGRAAWDSTEVIQWTFFGRRTLTWDKKNGRCRIEVPADTLTFLLDLKNKTGKIKKGDVVMTEQDSIEKYAQRGYEIWINDSYWLVMPFKLKDSGVTLKYVGVDTTQAGMDADVLELTFADVGVTPENKYEVFVDQSNRLVTQWNFYTSYQDTLPRFSTPWANYEKKGKILLSGNRGVFGLTNIAVMDHADESLFNSF